MTTTYVGTLSAVGCPTCGMVFGVPPIFEIERRRDHASFYCPAGHRQYYPHKSDEELLEEERQRAKRLSQRLEDEYQQHRKTERRLNATRGVVTRTKKRIAAGVCPCCQRSFAALGRHMADMHPDYVKESLPSTE
jgi:hypothetical protein